MTAKSVEKHSIKIQLISVLLAVGFIISVAWSISDERRDILSRVGAVEKEIKLVKGDVKANKEKGHTTDIALAEINTKLDGIATTLLKIERGSQ